jgi:hypothetical protein
MVIRMMETSDQLRLAEFHHIIRTMLGWDGDLGHAVEDYGRPEHARIEPGAGGRQRP